MLSCLLGFVELGRVADVGRKARQGGAWRPMADKPKGYEPAVIIQEFARAHRTFAFWMALTEICVISVKGAVSKLGCGSDRARQPA